jgi:hypothetical protein
LLHQATVRSRADEAARERRRAAEREAEEEVYGATEKFVTAGYREKLAADAAAAAAEDAE